MIVSKGWNNLTQEEKLNFMGVILAYLIRVFGADLMRYKGVLSIAGKPRRVIVQGVHELLGSSAGAPWAADEVRHSTFVFIGRDLPREIIAQGLEKSLV